MHISALLLFLPVAFAQYAPPGGGNSPTTTAASTTSTKASSTKTTASSTAVAAAAQQSGVHDINVGQGGFMFSPNSITAAVGDKVNFHFFAGNHSVAQSSFAAPCVPDTGVTPIYSGFNDPTGTATEASQMFTITINDTNPIWLYCSQVTHCQSGMAMVINPPSGANTLAAYQSAAKGVPTSGSPAAVAGGVLAANAAAASGSSSASPSASASATSSASASAASASSSGAAWTGKDMSGAAAMVAAAGGAFAYMLM